MIVIFTLLLFYVCCISITNNFGYIFRYRTSYSSLGHRNRFNTIYLAARNRGLYAARKESVAPDRLLSNEIFEYHMSLDGIRNHKVPQHDMVCFRFLRFACSIVLLFLRVHRTTILQLEQSYHNYRYLRKHKISHSILSQKRNWHTYW